MKKYELLHVRCVKRQTCSWFNPSRVCLVMQEANAGILGLFLTGRTVPQLSTNESGQNIVTGSANSCRLLYGALQRDGMDNESLKWLEVDAKIAQLEARLDKYDAASCM